MSCFYPRVAVPSGLTDSGKTKYTVIPSDSMSDPFIVLSENSGAILVPCGKCRGCCLDYSRRWADRMMLELETAGKAIFLTLTYNNNNVPWIYDDCGVPIWQTLCKRDFQLFMKRLRKFFTDRKIRFFACGEYGENTLRPHYHAIIFGLDLSDFSDLEQIGKNRQGDHYFTSASLVNIWSKGYITIAKVSYETCAYVARYVSKKHSNDSLYLENIGVEPIFCVMSRRPGIGKEYLDLHPDALDHDYINISTPTGGRKISMPKYYLKQLALTNPDKYDNIIERRKLASFDNLFLNMQNTDLDFSDFFENADNVKRLQTIPLKRSSI